MNITTVTLVHTVLSLIGMVAGCVVAGGFASGRQLDRWTGTFLITTALTNITGFAFPFTQLLPSHYIAILSLVVIPVVLFARYRKHLAGAWRNVYVVGSVAVLYLNVFVLVNQLFRRVPGLIVAAPTGKEAPFAITQLLVLAMFVWLGRAAVKGYRTSAAAAVESLTRAH